MDFAIRRRLDKLKDKPEPKEDNNNFNLSPPPPLPSFSQRPPSGIPPTAPFEPSPSGRFLEPFQRPTALPRPPPPLKLKGFIGIPPAPSAPPLSPGDYFFLGPSTRSVSPAPRPLTPAAPPLSPLAFTMSNNLYGSQAQILTRKKEEIKNAIQK